MKCETGWAHEPAEKADVFAECFASKFVLPAPVFNEFAVEWPCRLVRSFLLVRSKHVFRCLENLNEDSGTGPDELFAKVLKVCAAQLGFPLSKLIRRIVLLCCWPSAWVVHCFMPLHKRQVESDAGNYRAINLTAQISKVVKRYLSRFFVPASEQRALELRNSFTERSMAPGTPCCTMSCHWLLP